MVLQTKLRYLLNKANDSTVDEKEKDMIYYTTQIIKYGKFTEDDKEYLRSLFYEIGLDNKLVEKNINVIESELYQLIINDRLFDIIKPEYHDNLLYFMESRLAENDLINYFRLPPAA